MTVQPSCGNRREFRAVVPGSRWRCWPTDTSRNVGRGRRNHLNGLAHGVSRSGRLKRALYMTTRPSRRGDPSTARSQGRYGAARPSRRPIFRGSSPTTVAIAALAIAVLVAACGSNPQRPDDPAALVDSRPEVTATTDPTASPTLTSRAGGTTQPRTRAPRAGDTERSSTSAKSPRSAGTPATSYPQHVEGTKPAPVTATLASDCVRRGGAQTLTIRGPAEMFISFDAQYSDGEDGRKYGGWGTGQIPPSGTYTSHWVVAPAAPTGEVTVWVAASGGQPVMTAFRQPTFTVAKACP